MEECSVIIQCIGTTWSDQSRWLVFLSLRLSSSCVAELETLPSGSLSGSQWATATPLLPAVLSSVLAPLHAGPQPFWCSLPGNSAEEQGLVSPTLISSPHATVLESKWTMRVLLLGVGLIPWDRVYRRKLSSSATLERPSVCSFSPSVPSALGRSLETGSSLRMFLRHWTCWCLDHEHFTCPELGKYRCTYLEITPSWALC